MIKLRIAGLAVAAGLVATTVSVVPAEAHTTGIHDNCTNLHQRWAHGVGRKHATDRTRGHTAPVRNFFHNTKKYRTAVRHNSDLDRDRDGIACEKH